MSGILSNAQARAKLIKELKLLLGGGMIDLHADPEHYDLAVEKAIDRYRTRSANAVEESYIFLEIQPEITTYTLPNEVSIVRKVYRRGASGNTAGGTFFDPFSAGIVNTIYGVPYASGTAGDLVTYEAANQYQELVGRMFGLEVQFTWSAATKKLMLHRKFPASEQVLLGVYNYKPENILLALPESRQWLRDYALASVKFMIGEARELFGNIPGPNGGMSLNGSQMKTDAQTIMDRLEEEAKNQSDGGDMGFPICIG